MTAQEKFDELLSDGVWPFLRDRDFKRTKANFHRAVGDNWQVVNLQKSAWSDRDAVQFTVNLAVALDRLRDGLHDWAEGKRPHYTRCHLQQRLGFLLRDDEDVWWDIDPHTDVASLADTINAALEQYAFPWLEARSTDDALLALMRSDDALRAEYPHHSPGSRRSLLSSGRRTWSSGSSRKASARRPSWRNVGSAKTRVSW